MRRAQAVRRLFRKYAEVVYVVLTAIDVVAAAVIVDRLVKVDFLPWGVAFLALLAASIAAHVVLYRDTEMLSKEAHTAILDNVLEIAARSLVFPESWDAVVVRAYCHRFDHTQRKLHYVTSQASDRFDDQFTDIPVDEIGDDGKRVFVIAEAVVSGRTVFRELPDLRSPAEIEGHVWSQIRFVLACPVHEMNTPRCESSCMGVVSFDTSTEGGEKINLNGKRARDIIIGVAQTASLLWS